MPRPTRRTLLGSAAALGVRAALGGGAAVPAPAAADGGVPFGTGPAHDALRRLLPHHAEQFRLVRLAPGDRTGDRFRVGGRAGRIEVAGTSPATLLTGVHHYLRHTCGAQLSWGGDQLALPDRLPAPGASAERSCPLPHRFALNDTHDGYTAPYADWPRWERLIDLLALHGVNEVLVTPGSEAVYHRLLTGFGYTDAEARAWIPEPTHQPWWLLQNMSSYGGPIDPALLARRARLGRRIADRLRALGMRPVLPGYFGTVPVDFAERNPGPPPCRKVSGRGCRARTGWTRGPACSPTSPPRSTVTSGNCWARPGTSRWICCTRAATRATYRWRTRRGRWSGRCAPRTPGRRG